MLTKFRNRLPDVGVVIVVSIFLIVLPVMLVVTFLAGIFPSKAALKFKGDYASWLRAHEGEEFFCYTNRKNSVEEVERYMVPALEHSVHIIKLIGKNPQSDMDEQFLSHSLYNLENVGFPNVMKIVNGKMHDRSIHTPVYNAIGQGQPEELNKLVLKAFVELRDTYKT